LDWSDADVWFLICIGFWLPLLARMVCEVTGVTDYNIVQNNGESEYLIFLAGLYNMHFYTASILHMTFVPLYNIVVSHMTSRCKGGSSSTTRPLPHDTATGNDAGAQEQELDDVRPRPERRSG
jgi:hypothetical protein